MTPDLVNFCKKSYDSSFVSDLKYFQLTSVPYKEMFESESSNENDGASNSGSDILKATVGPSRSSYIFKDLKYFAHYYVTVKACFEDWCSEPLIEKIRT